MIDTATKIVFVQDWNLEIQIKSYNANVKFLCWHFLFNFIISKIYNT